MDAACRVVCLFDNEEVGSESAYGAASSFLEDILKRIAGLDDFPRIIQHSYFISADMAHALHPNYA
jgi:aspartyl aminopeptidase